MPTINPTIVLCQPSSQTWALGQGDRLFRKPVIRVGKFHVPLPAGRMFELDVTPERLTKWAANFARMKQAGVRTDLTRDHERSATARLGDVLDLKVDGDQLIATAKPADDDAAKLLDRCPEVSIEIEPNYRDGSGNVYDEAVTAVSVVRQPVVPDQQPWERIAASLNSRTTDRTVLLMASDDQTEPTGDATTDPTGATSMFSADQIKTIRERLKLGRDINDEQLPDKVLASLQTLSDDRAKAASDLEAAQKQIEELRQQNKQLVEKSEPIKLGRDVEGVLQEAVDARLEMLIQEARITPAAAKKLGDQIKAGGALMLSRESNGGNRSRAMEILDALRENDPVQLAKIVGEKTGLQLGRLADPLQDDDEDLLVNLMEEQAKEEAANN